MKELAVLAATIVASNAKMHQTSVSVIPLVASCCQFSNAALSISVEIMIL